MSSLTHESVDESTLPSGIDAEEVALPGSAAAAAAPPTSNLVSLRMLFSDAAIYGFASVVDRAIGFLLLPLMTVLLSPSDYGIIGLFTTSAHLAFVVCSLCIHQSFLRHYTEAGDDESRNSVIGTSIVLAIAYWLAVLPILIFFAGPLSRLIFGLSGSELTYVLAAVTVVETFDALAGNRLQADGRPWALFWIRIGGSLALRTAGVIAVLYGAGAWGWILADALGRMMSALILAAVAFRRVRVRTNPRLLRPLASYGAMLVPAMLSFYAMTVTDKFSIRALAPSPLEQVGLYSVGERIAGIMHLVNLAFILGWQRFAFRNMHLPGGSQVIGRGLSVFLIGGGYLAMSLALLGDDLTYWFISPKFWGGMPVILPLTIAAYFGGLASAAELGLHKSRSPHTISLLNVGAALLNVALNLLAIPRWGIVGAAVATLIAQAVRLVVIWQASQRHFPIRLEVGRLSAALGLFVVMAAAGQALRPFGWTTATAGQLLIVIVTPGVLWALPILPAGARQSVRRAMASLW